VHDLKNPLCAVLTNMEYVAQESSLSVDAREALHDGLIAADRAHTMILNLLDISRSEDGALVPELAEFDLGTLLSEVVTSAEVHAKLKHQRLRIDSSLSDPIIRADVNLLRRVMANQIDNAIRYSPDGSTIDVDAVTEGGEIRIRVSDQGPGIPEAMRERVFQKYVRLDGSGAAPQGHGLGLVFCRLAAEALGGRIWIEDNPPQGSRFCMSLPQLRRATWSGSDVTSQPLARC
jgi:signal transduction histidine kinase